MAGRVAFESPELQPPVANTPSSSVVANARTFPGSLSTGSTLEST